MPRFLAPLLALLACAPAPGPSPAPAAAPVHVIGVTVVEAREQDISKAQGHPNLHTYLTLRADDGTDPAALAYAAEGLFQVNIASTRLAAMISPAPAVGDHLVVEGHLSGTTPSYIDLVRVSRP